MSFLYKLWLGVVLFASCQPEPNIPLLPQSKKVSIAYLKSLYRGYPYQVREDICIEGLFISNDFEGNFHKAIVLEDETGGIDLRIDMEDIFLQYDRGRRYVVVCNGLTLGSYGGTVELGYPSSSADYQVAPIPSEKITSHFALLSDQEYLILPTVLNSPNLSTRYISCWSGFDPVQFVDEELGLAWTEEGRDTDRHMVNQKGDTLVIRTNYNAHYSEHILPNGSGRVEGIMGYFNQEYQLRLTTQYFVLLDRPRFELLLNNELPMNSLAAMHPKACPSTPECGNH